MTAAQAEQHTVHGHPAEKEGDVVGVRARVLCDIAGITYRQLDHWVGARYLHPANDAAGTGNPRLFDQDQIDHAVAMVGLVAAGLTHEAADRVARQIRGKHRQAVAVAVMDDLHYIVCYPDTTPDEAS